jgi:hypothetical protein
MFSYWVSVTNAFRLKQACIRGFARYYIAQDEGFGLYQKPKEEDSKVNYCVFLTAFQGYYDALKELFLGCSSSV